MLIALLLCLGRGCHLIAWLKSLIEKPPKIPSLNSFSYSANIVVRAFEKGLVPFRSSPDNRLDGVVLGSFRFDYISF